MQSIGSNSTTLSLLSAMPTSASLCPIHPKSNLCRATSNPTQLHPQLFDPATYHLIHHWNVGDSGVYWAGLLMDIDEHWPWNPSRLCYAFMILVPQFPCILLFVYIDGTVPPRGWGNITTEMSAQTRPQHELPPKERPKPMEHATMELEDDT